MTDAARAAARAACLFRGTNSMKSSERPPGPDDSPAPRRNRGELEPPAGPVAALDRLAAELPPADPTRRALLRLRGEVAAQEEMIGEARAAIEQLEEVVKKVTAPANRIGLLLALPERDLAHVLVGGSDYFCRVDPRMPASRLRRGARVLVNEAFAVVGDLGPDPGGPVVKVAEVLSSDRLRIGQDHGLQSAVLIRSAEVQRAKIKAGDEVRADPAMRVALEVMVRPESKEHYLEDVPELPWEKVGGQAEAISAIRDAIELPLVHGELFRRFEHAVPKGFLLHGPPGCGKTLIGKATAWNLTQQYRERTGREARECFLHVKGPEILNMWVGESERMVRELFENAREKRRQGFLPFIFIDEAESILGTRRAGRHASILSTLVPMFCTEMDGIESLEEVVIILASNRADLIDPAILRPGRIDRKIRVRRPDRAGAREIFRIYLHAGLPYDAALLADCSGSPAAASERLADLALERLFSPAPENRFLEVTLRSGRKESLRRGDLLSGALIASIAERAKGAAIKRTVSGRGDEEGISSADMLAAADAEFAENDVFPPGDLTEDWLKLVDHETENVVRVAPVRVGRKREGSAGVI